MTWIAYFHFNRFHGPNIELAGIIYLHRISDNRMTGSLLTTIETFKALCDMKLMPNVVIATTMWGECKQAKAEKREEELKATFLKDMVDSGCALRRFEDTVESAWKLVSHIMRKDSSGSPVIVKEMDSGTPFERTAAVKVAKRSWWSRIVGIFRRGQK